jgi:carbon dioxide concentrating mechanism protein CcmO
MESYQNGNGRRKKRVSQSALGLVSTLSFPVIVSTADAMLKASSVTLVGYENRAVVTVLQLCGVRSRKLELL